MSLEPKELILQQPSEYVIMEFEKYKYETKIMPTLRLFFRSSSIVQASKLFHELEKCSYMNQQLPLRI